MRTPTRLLAASVLALGLSGCTPTTPSAPAGAGAEVPPGTDDVVERVVDGDTLVLEGAGRTRLIGVDTPESVDPDRPVECHGPEAAAHTRELLPEGTRVRVVLGEEERDRYDRTLAYVYRSSDGLFVNADLAAGGWAETLVIEPNTLHAEAFGRLEAAARSAPRGLWESCR